MRRLRRRMTAVLTALLLLTLLIPWGLAEPAPGPHQTTVLFTHDLHSHFLPLERADGGESGGYARLASALKEEQAAHPGALTVDGGDVLFLQYPPGALQPGDRRVAHGRKNGCSGGKTLGSGDVEK